MLTSRRAFDRPSVVETMTSVLKDDPTKFPETEKIPDELRRFVFRCLEKDPADRYQTARDLMLDLRAYQAEQLREAAERVTFRTEPPWKHRKPRIALRAAGGVLLFVLGFWSGSCWQRARPPASLRTSAGAPPSVAR
jgi:serine/threonine protein kinase